MLSKAIVDSLLELNSPVLTVYLNTQSQEPSAHGLTSRQSLWLAQEAKRLFDTLLPEEQATFQQQVERTLAFLGDRASEEQALLILASPSEWRVLPLPLKVENELHWGRSALSQLEMLLDENKPHCVVVLDRKAARFFRYWLGGMYELSKQTFDIDISRWKRKDQGHVVGQNVQKARGSQRDVFEHRVDAQYKRFCREVAHEAKHLCDVENLDMVFLVGSKRLTEPIRAEFPKAFRKRLVSIEEDLGQLPLSGLQIRLKEKISRALEKEQLALITKLVDDPRHSVLGVDETLAQLQKGKVRTLVFSDHLTGTLHECIECGWIDRSSDPVCSVCGRERRTADLRDVLFNSARSANTDVAVVTGGAATKLNELGGVGGWLRGRTQAELR